MTTSHRPPRLAWRVLSWAAVTACLAPLGCGPAAAEAHAEAPHEGSIVGQTVPDLTLPPLHGGQELRMANLRGKVVLLDVWASWCAPCKEELPMLDDMAGRLSSKGIQIVAVSIDDSAEDAEGFLQSKPSWSIAFAHDPEGKSLGILQPPKMPSSFIIDGQGVIREVNAGFTRGDAEKMEARLVEVSSSTKVKTASNPTPPTSGKSVPEGAHPVPKSTGSIDGRPFVPKLGHVMGKTRKDGRVLVSFTEQSACTPLRDLQPGDGVLTVLVPWQEGFKTQLGAGGNMRGKNKHQVGAMSFARLDAAKRKKVSATFKPTGSLAVVSAPTQSNALGKVSLDVTSGDYTLVGEVDVDLCPSVR